MLTSDEKALIDQEIAKFPVRKSASLEALLVVQRQRGYISDEALKAVAEYLSMTPTELSGIASFYNLIFRKPVGRYVIRLCDSVSCWIMGYEAIQNFMKTELDIDWGETTPDQKFTLLPAQCLGACDGAPAMMINDRLYRNLTEDLVKTIIKFHKQEGNSDDTATNGTHEKRWPATLS